MADRCVECTLERVVLERETPGWLAEPRVRLWSGPHGRPVDEALQVQPLAAEGAKVQLGRGVVAVGPMRSTRLNLEADPVRSA